MLFFYPFDFTFVCPTEILTFSEKAPEFEAKGVQVRHELRAKRSKSELCAHLPSLHPDARGKMIWDMAFSLLLVRIASRKGTHTTGPGHQCSVLAPSPAATQIFLCFLEPLHIGFPGLFEAHRSTWDAFEVSADMILFFDMALSAITAYHHNQHLVRAHYQSRAQATTSTEVEGRPAHRASHDQHRDRAHLLAAAVQLSL